MISSTEYWPLKLQLQMKESENKLKYLSYVSSVTRKQNNQICNQIKDLRNQ